MDSVYAPERENAPVGDTADLVLPGFIDRRGDGVFVDLTRLSSGEEFARIVDRIFATGHVLRGLDYDRFQRLLFDTEALRDSVLSVRLASELAVFPEARQALYRTVRIVDGDAEYLFEPVMLDTTVDEPIYAEENGERVVIGIEHSVVSQPTSLDFDEFVAYLWGKGVRFGIDEVRVKQAIQSGKTEKIIIAHEQPPGAGKDAGLEEQTQALHRNNAPRILPDGRVDLSQFTNRFPQVLQGAHLLMKTPRELGKAGRRLDGSLIDPDLPKDFDLATLAGEGTRIEQQDGKEYIVAILDGFLNLDAKTNQISVTEKIINREGVSARTTGNLALSGQEYEEFGEVQEGRMVEGYSLTFHENVFGRVASAGGRILLEKNLVGGAALNRDGEIVVQGLASGAVLQTARGDIRVKRAENCVIVADRVDIEWAYHCVILASEIKAEMVESCAIAGKQIAIESARVRGAEETLISLLVPDLSGFERQRQEEEAHIAECEQMASKLRAGIQLMGSQPEMQQYLLTAGKLKRKELTLTPAQTQVWQQLGARLAPALKRLQQARQDAAVLDQEVVAARERIVGLEQRQEQAGEGVAVSLALVGGETLVRTLAVPVDSPALNRLSPKELTARLRTRVVGETVLFSADCGSFDWKYGAE